jgi:hypothetical protein
MAELGIPDPFDDGIWASVDAVQLPADAWDSHDMPDNDDSLFDLLDHLNVHDGDPAISPDLGQGDSCCVDVHKPHTLNLARTVHIS